MMSHKVTGAADRLNAGYVLVKCGKIALVLRLACTYPVALAWAYGGSLSGLLLLIAVLMVSITALLAWERVASFVIRHPLVLALDIVLSLVVFASADTPTAYMGYLGSTALIIGLFFPLLGQVLLTSLLSLGYLLVVAINSANTSEVVNGPGIAAVSVVLFASLTYVGYTMQKLQRQVDATLEKTREAAAEAALGQERSRLARELHDSLVKSLEGISLQAKAMVMTGKSAQEAAMIRDAATSSIEDSRRLLRGLREGSVPPLADALQTLVEEVSALHGVRVELDVQGCLNLPLDVRYTAHKIAEEAVFNAAKHSGAQQLECTASCSEGVLRLWVRDRGRGLSQHSEQAARSGNHYGLAGMRERAEEVGGTLEIDSGEDRGTAVMLTVSLTEQMENV